MRKLLSILASVGLVATASTSVVSCTKKDKTPTYHSVQDIKKNFVGDNQLISDADMTVISSKTPDQDKLKEAKKHVIGTIASGFKNPKDILDDFNSGKIDVALQGLNAKNADGSSTWLFEVDQMSSTVDNKGNKTVVSSSPQVIMKSKENVNYLDDATKSEHPFAIDLINSDSYYTSTLRNEYSEMMNIAANDRLEWIQLETKGQAMVKMDMQLFTDLANAQNPDENNEPKLSVTPGFDKDGLRYDSLSQQFVAAYSDETKSEQIANGFKNWKQFMYDLNAELLNDMNTSNLDMSKLGNDLISQLNKPNKKSVNWFTLK